MHDLRSYIVLIALSFLALFAGCEKGDLPVSEGISPKNREILDRIDKRNKEAERYSLYEPDKSGRTPGFLVQATTYEEVDDIQAFLRDFMLWQQEKIREARRIDTQKRLRLMAERGITPGAGYNPAEYIERFEWLLDTMTQLGETGDLTKAAELSQFCESVAEVNARDQDSSAMQTLSLILRARLLWTKGSVFAEDELFNESLSVYDRLLSVVQKENVGLMKEVKKEIAGRRIMLAESGFSPDRNLKIASEILESIGVEELYDLSALVDLFKVRRGLADYQGAYALVPLMLKYAKAKNAQISGITMHELICTRFLARLPNPSRFLEKFGPFAPSIYAECKGITLAETWHAVYGTDFDCPNPRLDDTSGGILIGKVVIYEPSTDPTSDSQPDIIIHEMIHSAVKNGQTFKSEGTWYKAFRDVPTAALWSYVNRHAKCRASERQLPTSLAFFGKHGQLAVEKAPGEADTYIENMLAYFVLQEEETNASYQCAAILAGMLIEIIGPPDSRELQSYISHLKIMSHQAALDKGKRGVSLEL